MAKKKNEQKKEIGKVLLTDEFYETNLNSFFFHGTATTEIFTPPQHDALEILVTDRHEVRKVPAQFICPPELCVFVCVFVCPL